MSHTQTSDEQQRWDQIDAAADGVILRTVRMQST